MLRDKTETRPGLVALYDIRPGNGAGPFLQPRSPHGASVCYDGCLPGAGLLGLGLGLGLEAKFSGLGFGLETSGLGLEAFGLGLGLVFLALALFKAKVKVTNILPNTVYLGKLH